MERVKRKANEAEMVRNWFDSYANQFIKEHKEDEQGNNGYSLKIEHTKNVVDNMEKLGRSLKLGKHQMDIAKAIAILHDVGRFEQLHITATKYDKPSFSDRIIDHAKLGAEIASKSSALNGFSDHDKDIVYKAIEYHNLYSLPKGLTGEEKLFCRLIRDADKIDIIRADLENRESQKGNSLLYKQTTGISDEAYNTFMSHNALSKASTGDEVTLLRMAFIFDLNFKESFKIFKEMDYVERLGSYIKDAKKGQIIEEAKSYVDAHLLEIRR